MVFSRGSAVRQAVHCMSGQNGIQMVKSKNIHVVWTWTWFLRDAALIDTSLSPRLGRSALSRVSVRVKYLEILRFVSLLVSISLPLQRRLTFSALGAAAKASMRH